MKELLKTLDEAVLDQTFRRVKLNARRLTGTATDSPAKRRLTALARERRLEGSQFICRTEAPRFIGGTTGRSGTRWLVRLLKAQFPSDPVVSDEIGVFVLAVFREAAYEYYQLGTDDAAVRRAPYLHYFLRQMERYAFLRRRVYGSGMRGLADYVPRRAIRMAWEALRDDLPSLTRLDEITERFGRFYLHLLNYHAAIVHGGPSGWISKEPPYGRHADELLAMVPEGRLVVLARDGRASALSMYRRGWGESIRSCMERWGNFAAMTLSAIDRVERGDERLLLLRYEDLVTDFDSNLRGIYDFFSLPAPAFDTFAKDESLTPRPESLDKWKQEIPQNDLRWFDEHYGELMERLGYTE